MNISPVMLLGLPFGAPQDPNTPKPPSNTKNIDDSSGNEFGVPGATTPDKKPNHYFKPGQVKVVDSGGTEPNASKSNGPPSKSIFKPGQVKVDDSRGSEKGVPTKAPVVSTPPSRSIDLESAKRLSYPPINIWALNSLPEPYNSFVQGNTKYLVEKCLNNFSKQTFLEIQNKKFAKDVYQLLLGREIQPWELEARANQLQTGEFTPEDLIKAVLISDEFNQKNPMSNEEFTRSLYRLILQREAKPNEVSGWASALDSGQVSRKQMIEKFQQSSEYLSDVAYPRFKDEISRYSFL